MSGKKPKTKYVSKGQRRSVATRVPRTEMEIILNKQRAFLDGKRVWFTIPNPNPLQTNKRFIRVLAKDLYGDYRKYNERVVIK